MFSFQLNPEQVNNDLATKANLNFSNIDNTGEQVIINNSTPNGNLSGEFLTIGTPYTAAANGEYYIYTCLNTAAKTVYINSYAVGQIGGSGVSRNNLTFNLRVGDIVLITNEFHDAQTFAINYRGK